MNDIALSDFISTTLIEITKGVKEANTKLGDADNNAHRVYELRSTRDDAKTPGIKFDVALSATGIQKDKGGFVVALASIGGGANTEKQKGHEQQHRIQFEVGVNQYYT
ncbi:MAG: hypothetical protein GY834_13145 [Bacteroidetes bacterium]|nr:hypothetical protein [Bacteroidota bacterium]